MSNSKSNSFPRSYEIRDPKGKVITKKFANIVQLLKAMQADPKKVYHVVIE
jgi:hypothetical protein